jgi:hypothetical protein
VCCEPTTKNRVDASFDYASLVDDLMYPKNGDAMAAAVVEVKDSG